MARIFTEEYSSGYFHCRSDEQCDRNIGKWEECVQKNIGTNYTLNLEKSIEKYPFATAIGGMIKNAEGKINGKITYARITIRCI
ncbi:hypothetical protein [Bacteroides heparinolyticus]|uniref:hypothetical protein n=1 Tax=Prevotella heparinolytica TaxID=28113 RepID=UPI0035A13FBE